MVVGRKLPFWEVPIFRSYCWWKKSCTTWDVENPKNNGINNLSTGAGFQPSTVAIVLFHLIPPGGWVQVPKKILERNSAKQFRYIEYVLYIYIYISGQTIATSHDLTPNILHLFWTKKILRTTPPHRSTKFLLHIHDPSSLIFNKQPHPQNYKVGPYTILINGVVI